MSSTPGGWFTTTRGGRLWVASLYRSLRTVPLNVVQHQTGPAKVLLWWGPLEDINNGDLLFCFPTPYGIEVEHVVPAAEAADVLRTLPPAA